MQRFFIIIAAFCSTLTLSACDTSEPAPDRATLFAEVIDITNRVQSPPVALSSGGSSARPSLLDQLTESEKATFIAYVESIDLTVNEHDLEALNTAIVSALRDDYAASGLIATSSRTAASGRVGSSVMMGDCVAEALAVAGALGTAVVSCSSPAGAALCASAIATYTSVVAAHADCELNADG